VNPLEQLYPFVNNVRPFSKVRWFDLNHHAPNIGAILSGFTNQVFNQERRFRMFRWALNIISRARPDQRRIVAGLQGAPVGADVLNMVADDQAPGLRRAAQRLLGLMRRTQCVVFGHSHELIDGYHDVNRRMARGRTYLNPGAWLPCRRLPDEAEPVTLDTLCGGGSYPYELAFARVFGDSAFAEGRCEVFERGEVWLRP
jgi:hypothetical protein